MTTNQRKITRRELLQHSSLAAAGLALGPGILMASDASSLPLITRPIPSTDERLPVIGVGTNRFGTDDAEMLAQIRQVLETMPKLGGTVVDTANSYGDSEAVIGRLVESIGNRDKLFLATKTPSRGEASMQEIMEAFTRLRTEQIDLVEVHNFNETDSVIPRLQQLKQDTRVRYIGCSTSRDEQYADLKAALDKYDLDFIQVDYSIDNRSAADEILPLARDKGVAVLINMPFGGRRNASSTFARVADVPLPDFAAEIDVTSWAQFFLKYVVSHPAVNVAIPGMTKLRHLEDNMLAARGRLPDAAMRSEMEKIWDAI